MRQCLQDTPKADYVSPSFAINARVNLMDSTDPVPAMQGVEFASQRPSRYVVFKRLMFAGVTVSDDVYEVPLFKLVVGL